MSYVQGSQPLALEGRESRRADFLWWLVCVGVAVVVAAGIARAPGLVGAVGVVVGALLVGFVAPVRLALGLLGFLIVFDSVFSLGTTVGASAPLVILGVSISNPLLIGLAARLVTDWGLQRRRMSSVGLWIGGMIAVGSVLSSALGPYGFSRASLTLIGAGLVVMVLLSYGDRLSTRSFLLGIAVGVTVAAGTGLIALFTAERGVPAIGYAFDVVGRNLIEVPRVTGLFQNPLALAFALLVGIFAAMATVDARPLRWGLVGILLTTLPFTYSRGGAAGTFLGLVTYASILIGCRRGRSRLGSASGWLLVTVNLVAGLILVVVALRWASASPVGSQYVNPESVTVRVHLIQGALSVWTSHPILGIGPGQFVQHGGYGLQAHNTFLEVGAELGLLGFAALLTLAWLALMRSVRRALGARTKGEVRFHGSLAAGVIAVGFMAGTVTLVGVKLMWALLACAALPNLRLTAPPDQPSVGA
jgi:putative inorganic carbon (HCO3(-)) transporter